MRGQVHLQKVLGNQITGLMYEVILPDEYDPEGNYPLIVMLHGFGANMRTLAWLAPAISPDGYIYVCPNGPLPFDLGRSDVGYGWHSPRSLISTEEFHRSETLLANSLDEIFETFKSTHGQAILVGFGSGGGMTYRYGLSRPETFAGLVILSAAMPHPQELDGKIPNDRSQRIFISHGIYDPLVPMERGLDARIYLESLGYQLEYHEYPMGHEISTEVLNALKPWVADVLPPLR